MGEITLYSYPSSTSGMKAKKWLESRNIKFKLRHTLKHPLTPIELKQMLSMVKAQGIESIISIRSRDFQEREDFYDEMSLNDFLKEIHNNPKLVKVPIIITGSKLICGYDPKALEKNFKLN